MHADPGSLRERLKSSTQEASRLYYGIESMLPYKEVRLGQPLSRQKLTASTIPWHGQAAAVFYEFHAEIRRLEVNMRGSVSGLFGSRRGGSDRNTELALKAIVNLAEAVDDQTVAGVLSFFDRWIRRAQAVFSPDLGLHRIPREPGGPEMRCPYCEYDTLRWQPATGVMVCVNPECHTADGVRPRWFADYELADEQMRFVWREMKEGAV